MYIINIDLNTILINIDLNTYISIVFPVRYFLQRSAAAIGEA